MTTSVQDPKPKRYVHLVDAGIDLPLQDQEHIVKKIHNIFDGPVSRVLLSNVRKSAVNIFIWKQQRKVSIHASRRMA